MIEYMYIDKQYIYLILHALLWSQYMFYRTYDSTCIFPWFHGKVIDFYSLQSVRINWMSQKAIIVSR